MSFALVEEVLEYAPVELTAAERLLLVCIARAAQDEDRMLSGRPVAARTCFPGRDKLKHWTGLNDRGLSEAMLRLSKRGLEVRVPAAVDKLGRPMFAVRGHATEYRLPVLKGHATADPTDNKGHATADPTENKGHATASEWARHRVLKGTPQRAPKDKQSKVILPPTPQGSEPSGPARSGAATGKGEDSSEKLATDLRGRYPGMQQDEAAWITQQADDDPQTRKTASRLNQEIYVAQLRAQYKSLQNAAHRAAVRAGPRCEDHPDFAAGNCQCCKGDVKAGDRDQRFVGKHQPKCAAPTCQAPIIGQPEAAIVCREHVWSVDKGAA
jgi:hypothetical protein